jgi:hypothetical protein
MDGIDRAQWRKSSYSGGNGGNCLEIASLPDDSRAVRDSKDPEGPKLVFAPATWRTFTTAVKAGAFDLG